MSEPRLIAQTGPAAGLVLTFAEGEEWIVGRDPDEANLVVADPRVSRQHLVIRRTKGGLTVENLSDTNPAFLNHAPLEGVHQLQEGDQIQLGDTDFQFTALEDVAPPEPLFDEEEDTAYDTIFETPEPEIHAAEIYLEPQERWLLKVIAGPNAGAEVRLGKERSYVLGTDTANCDIVFHDLSVSRQHARLTVSEDEVVTIEDLGSRNGIIIEGQSIPGPHHLEANAVFALGTTTLLLVDREAPQDTVISPTTEQAEETEEEEEPSVAAARASLPEAKPPILSKSSLVVLAVAALIAILVVVGGISLFTGKEVSVTPKDYATEIQAAVAPFSDVRYSFNDVSGRLFILGHVLTPVDKNELLYNLHNLAFIQSIDDNVVVDQNIWEEMNAILAKNSEWTGVSMHAPRPGKFVLSGYLKTAKQAVTLQDYVHLNFPYLDRLDNRVVVEELLLTDVRAQLRSEGFSGVTPGFINGELTLSGHISHNDTARFQRLMKQLETRQGVRNVKNLTVLIAEDRSMLDLSSEYSVQGFSRHDGMTVNVLVDGQILSRGDLFHGMKIMSITSRMVILEKEGIKYKIDYNQHGLWQGNRSRED